MVSQKTGLVGGIVRFWSRSYAPDWFGFVVLETGYLLMQFYLQPFHRLFSLDDLSISYPHAAVQRVPTNWNLVYGGLVPFVVIVLWTLTFRPGVHTAHVSILGLFISHGLSSFMTDVVKNAVGRPRPDLIARCKPMKGTPEHILVSIDICTETDPHTLQDGWRSFPSGHSSFAFAGLGFLALYLAGQLRIFLPRADLSRVLLAFAPLIGAALIAISRLEDYRHDVWDVTCGSVLGMATAYFSYRRYYPPLRSPRCNEPYPSRATVALLEANGRMKGDEEVQNAADFELDGLADEEDAPLNNENGSGCHQTG